MTFGSELLLFAVGLLRVLPTVYCVCGADEINTKNRVADGGFALVWMVVQTVGKTSFPPCRLHHPHRHALHDAIHRDGKKSGLRPFKKSGFRRYKNS